MQWVLRRVRNSTWSVDASKREREQEIHVQQNTAEGTGWKPLTKALVGNSQAFAKLAAGGAVYTAQKYLEYVRRDSQAFSLFFMVDCTSDEQKTMDCLDTLRLETNKELSASSRL